MAHLSYLADWLNDDMLPSPQVKRIAKPTFRPQLEGLSERIMPNATTWTGAVSTDWMDANNWNNGVPGPNDDATITNQGAKGGPIISANEKAQASTITDNNGLPLIIQTQGSLELTGNSKQSSLWNADLTMNGVMEADDPNTTGNKVFWTGGNIHGVQTGSNPWGIYISGGASFFAYQKAQNLGVTMYVGMDQVNGGVPQNVLSYLNVSDAAAGNQLQQNLSLNNNANINIERFGQMNLNQNNNSVNAGGIVVDQPATSTSTIEDQGWVYHDGDKAGQPLQIQPQVAIYGGFWIETGKNGPATSINFTSQGGFPYSVTIAQGIANNGSGILNLGNGVSVIASRGIWLQNGGQISIPTVKGVALSHATIDASIFDGNGGWINIGDTLNAGAYASLTVNGNLDIESGGLFAVVGFDQNGNVSGFSRLSVAGVFSVDAVNLQNSTLEISTVLTNNVKPVTGQVINIVTATRTNTSKNPPTPAFDNLPLGYKALLTATGYQLTTS